MEDSWVLLSGSAFNLLQYVVPGEVNEGNMASYWNIDISLEERNVYLIIFSDICRYSSMLHSSSLSGSVLGLVKMCIWNFTNKPSIVCSIKSITLWINLLHVHDFVGSWSFEKYSFAQLCRFSKCWNILLYNIKKTTPANVNLLN